MLIDNATNIRQFIRELSKFPNLSKISEGRYKTSEGNVMVLPLNTVEPSKIFLETNGMVTKEILDSKNLKVTSAGIWNHLPNKIELVLRF